MTVTTPVLSIRDLSKRFGPVIALEQVGLEVGAGEVVAVCGENGAGKSTLMKILAGAERADAGRVTLNGELVSFRDVREAADAGISIVFQELSLFPDIDVLTNVAGESTPRRFGYYDRRAMRQRAQPILGELGLDKIDLDRAIGRLALSERQLLEIAKAVLNDAKVLILDEPNSALSAADTERLFAVVRRLSSLGVAILYVSHRLEEVFEISDRIVVMRNGAVVAQTNPTEGSIPNVVKAMIGKEVERLPTDFSSRAGEMDVAPAVELDGVATAGLLRHVDFRIAPNEVVGVAGLEGSGAAEILDVIFGVIPLEHGQLQLGGRPLRFRAPRDAVRSGIARVPADRRRHGLMLEMPLTENVAVVDAGVLGRHGRLLDPRRLRRFAAARCTELFVKARDVDVLAGQLSGGNQQKVVLAKWLASQPQVILLDDPTRGVDVGAKAEIYRVIRHLAADGRAVLFRSSEMLEYEMTCDRVVIVRDGSTVAELRGIEITEHALLEGINAA